MQFIKGKWYKEIGYDSGDVYYFCFREKIGNYLYAGINKEIGAFYILEDNDGIDIKNLECDNIFTNHYNDYIYEEVEYSFIISMLPLGHPERNNFRKQRIKSLLL